MVKIHSSSLLALSALGSWSDAFTSSPPLTVISSTANQADASFLGLLPPSSLVSQRGHHHNHHRRRHRRHHHHHHGHMTRIASTATPADEMQQSSSSSDTNDVSMDVAPKHQFLGEGIPYSDITIGVMKETYPGECRVSQTPDTVKKLVDAGFDVVVQSGAGDCASFSDAAYVEVGAVVFSDQSFFDQVDIISKIRPPNEDEVPKLAGKTLVSMISPSLNGNLYKELTAQGTTLLALDCVPRMLSRAQAFDVLSSQTNIAGYRAVIEAAEHFPRFFAGQMTAAGKIPPAKVRLMSIFRSPFQL